jgi:predicted nucleic acid-binding protein
VILVDTSVIADLLTKDPVWSDWSGAQVAEWADQGPVCFDPIIFGELAVHFDTQKELENRLSAFTFIPLPLAAAFQAGKAFGKYRRAGGKKARPLPDFLIGAHAYVAHIPLLTRDPRRVRTFFPSVHIITPA